MNITTTEGKQITLVMPFQIVDAGAKYIKAIGEKQWYRLLEWSPGCTPVVGFHHQHSDACEKLESLLHSLPSVNLRAFEVRYVSPTNHKPSRIKIIDHWYQVSITIPINSTLRNCDQAKAHLNSLGIEITSHAYSNSMDLLLSPNFETRLKK